MQLAGKGLLILLRDRIGQRDRLPALLHIADRCDPKLADLLRRLNAAQAELDQYVLSHTEWSRSE